MCCAIAAGAAGGRTVEGAPIGVDSGLGLFVCAFCGRALQ